jgi:hypothetical protein
MNQEHDHRSRVVVLAGSLTTLLALGGVFAAAHHGENIMGWYANYVIPAGAIFVGLVAASGYGLAAWWTGLKMSRRLIWSVVAELAVAYFIAHYEEYRRFYDYDSPASFFQWFDETTRNFAWQSHGGERGEPLGVLGYGLRALEIVGFVGGGALVPIGLRTKPYCDPCRTYKRTRRLALMRAGVASRLLGAVGEADAARAYQGALDGIAAIFAAAEKGDRALLEQHVATHAIGKRAAARLTAYAMVSLVRCPRCSDGGLVSSLVTGRGRNVQVQKLSSVALAPDRVQALFG